MITHISETRLFPIVGFGKMNINYLLKGSNKDTWRRYWRRSGVFTANF